MRKSPIILLAAAVTAVTAVALGATPGRAAPLSPGKRDDHKAVAFPLLAVKDHGPSGVISHVSHQSHVSGGPGHISHVSHSSHISSVPGPAPTSAVPVSPTTFAPAPAPAATTPSPSPSPSPSPTLSPADSAGGSSAVVPAPNNQTSSPAATNTSPAANKGGGCAFVVLAPIGALARWSKRLARIGRAR